MQLILLQKDGLIGVLFWAPHYTSICTQLTCPCVVTYRKTHPDVMTASTCVSAGRRGQTHPTATVFFLKIER